MIREGDFLGVVATREEQAIEASEALRLSAKWAMAEDLPDSGKIHAWLTAQPSVDGVVGEKKDPSAAPIVRQMEETYTKRYVACVADVEVDRRIGHVAVTRVVAAADAGQVINPKGLEMQKEGGIVQSASWTPKEAVRFDRTRVNSRDWSSYPVLTFPEGPMVEVHLLNRPEEEPLGSGEASSGPAAAAIVNEVSNALSRRVRDLPLTAEKIRGAPG